MLRWIELGAFQSIFRTHEGLRPDWSHQFDTDQETLRHIARFSNVYNAWHDYRQSLVSEAAERGWPVVRHPFLHYPEDGIPGRCPIKRRVGSELSFTLVLNPGVDEIAIRRPAGNYKQALTRQRCTS